MIPYFLLIAGFFILVKGADIMVEGAVSIARRLNVSEIVIGLTVVAFGTSTPELFVNVFATITGKTDIAIGNVIGSNIANILLIIGVSGIITPLLVPKGTVWQEIPFGFLASILLAVVINDAFFDGVGYNAVTRTDGLSLLSLFCIFLYHSVNIAKKIDGSETVVPSEQLSIMKALGYFFGGLIGLTIGGKWIVDSAVEIASRFGMDQTTIGLTIVAVGTSLPELATSAVAAWKQKADIAVGNVVGSNIFNILFVLGISSVIQPLPFQPQNNLDIIVMLAANIFLFSSMFSGRKYMVDRWEGIIFLCCYIIYVGFLLIVK